MIIVRLEVSKSVDRTRTICPLTCVGWSVDRTRTICPLTCVGWSVDRTRTICPLTCVGWWRYTYGRVLFTYSRQWSNSWLHVETTMMISTSYPCLCVIYKCYIVHHSRQIEIDVQHQCNIIWNVLRDNDPSGFMFVT